MDEPEALTLLDQIRGSGSAVDHIHALRALKNDIVGHQQKKAIWVRRGVVDPVVRMLTSYRPPSKQHGKEGHDAHPAADTATLSEKEMARLQALYVVGSLAQSRPPVLRPSHCAEIVPAILFNVCPSSNPPVVVLAALRALSSMSNSVMLASDTSSFGLNALSDSVFAPSHANSIRKILLQFSSTPTIQSEISETTSLIGVLCREERHQSALEQAGVLDALASRLASVVVSQGLVLPAAGLVAQKHGLQDCIPPAVPQRTGIAGILEAIAVVISDSKFRAARLVCSDAIRAIFPTTSPIESYTNGFVKGSWGPPSTHRADGQESGRNAIDMLIPNVPLTRTRSASALSSAFPPLGASLSFERLTNLAGSRVPNWSRSSPAGQTGSEVTPSTCANVGEIESPLIAYLIWLVRTSHEIDRLMAAFLLAVLYRTGFAAKSREAAMGMLIVPLVVQLLRGEQSGYRSSSDNAKRSVQHAAVELKIRERAPDVLAMLIVDSECLQKSAYDAGVITKLSDLIKGAYEPVSEGSGQHTWSPSDGVGNSADSADPLFATRNAGVSALLLHRIRVRESTLRAIAAFVPFKDEYRKALIDHGVMPYIVESLKQSPVKPSAKAAEKAEKAAQSDGDSQPPSPEYGVNPNSVLIAACGAVRHLSRSVSILRTTLIDSGVVMPIFHLLRHPDIDVQISATAATCNLVMDFSPMRQTIADKGVLKVLCEHAHSSNVKLRLNALWALKHMVHCADVEVKKSCLEELGQGWLIQLITDDGGEEPSTTTRSGPSFFAMSDDRDVHAGSHEDDGDSAMTDDGDSFSHSPALKQPLSHSPTSVSAALNSPLTNARLAALKDEESNSGRRARTDDIAVQEQGLDFIRNLIGGFPNVGSSEAPEMIDFILNALGQDQLFEILSSKLRSKVSQAPIKRSARSAYEIREVPPHPDIIAAVEYILVHMAASVPRHRQLVIAQSELLRQLVPHFNHRNKEVRLGLCWLAINLTWMDDQQDSQACSQRAQELVKLGFLAKLEALVEHDHELDIRERAKTAVWQMKQSFTP